MKLIITAFRSTAIIKLIFENLAVPSLKVEIVSFQMVIILLTTLKGLYRKKQKMIALIHGYPVLHALHSVAKLVVQTPDTIRKY